MRGGEEGRELGDEGCESWSSLEKKNPDLLSLSEKKCSNTQAHTRVCTQVADTPTTKEKKKEKKKVGGGGEAKQNKQSNSSHKT